MNSIKLLRLGAVLLAMLLTGNLVAQSDSTQTPSKKELRKARPLYFTLSFGGGVSSFTDYATSPLNYFGSHSYIGVGDIRMDKYREYGTLFHNTVGIYTDIQSDMMASSTGFSMQLRHYQLWSVKDWNTSKHNIKFGGQALLMGNFRTNSRLMNQAVGLEGFFHLMGVAQYARNISRPIASEKKIWFLTWKKKATNRFLKARIEIGLLNADFRNGYNYMGQSSLVNDNKIFDNHDLRMFSGMRMGTSISYNVYRPSGNLLQVAYRWDAIKSGKKNGIFQMGMHALTVSIMIHENPKTRRNFDESIF